MSTVDHPLILAIESSCDDTSAAVLRDTQVLSNCVATQQMHSLYGGVVPELASRAHQQHIVAVVHEALNKANIAKNDLSAIAFTKGPGLLGSLLVGVSFAKSLSQALAIPLIEVNHMQGHILAHFIAEAHPEPPKFPFLALTISGGHTQIVRVSAPDQFELLGQTLDDAVGECFDKSAKVLGFEYPGGPLIDKLAALGDPKAFSFSIPNVSGLDFSFSGLKTQFTRVVTQELKKDSDFVEKYQADLAASLQNTITEILVQKIELALKETGINQLAIGGGVAANSGIRKALNALAQRQNLQLFVPELSYCTDNAAMIGISGYFKYRAADFTDLSVQAEARYAVQS